MAQRDNTRDQGFEPMASGSPSVLILGSLPSQKSLREQQYYAHPQNAFWRLMGQVAGVDIESDYRVRCRQLSSAGIALWDVLASSVRPGSLDSAIEGKTAEANDLTGLLTDCPKIALICFNGQKARELFDRKCTTDIGDRRLLDLPSSSAAHASMTFAQKLDQWQAISDYLPLAEQEN